MNRFALFHGALFFTGLVAIDASAQLVVGTHTSASGAGGAYYINLNTLSATRLWNQTNNRRPSGLAADEAGGKLYVADSARLSIWNYGSIGTAPALMGSTGAMFRYDPATNTSAATGVDGLEYVNGVLYCWTAYSSPIFSDGIYSIATGGQFPGLMTPVWLNDDVYNFEGFAYNPADGKFYGTNTRSTSAKGLYAIDALNNPNAVPEFITGFDSTLGLSSFDGLAIGNGSAWLTQFVNGTATDNSDDYLVISKYNLTTHTYDDSFALATPSSAQIASAAAWAPGALTPVPEPTTSVALACLGMLAIRRRRR